ncbi:MAG TPA: NADH-quinone oxidoreductase subunit J [Vicinamibacterales bacterium]|jgi:NADH-quinone oxidoreductase subunit J|nr:NADH-quinone oxidoreductase subunit J [Vicinamibacterales bacterium]
MPESVLFYVLSGLAVAASALVIGQRNPMYSVLLLIVSFAALAGLYIVLDAPFVAMAQMIIYAGAIMVLFLFVVMLLNAPQEDGAEWDRTHPLRRPGVARIGILLAVVLVAELGWALTKVVALDTPVGARADGALVGSVRELGKVLFTDYAFAFEATSLLILVAMVGAVVLARKDGDA